MQLSTGSLAGVGPGEGTRANGSAPGAQRPDRALPPAELLEHTHAELEQALDAAQGDNRRWRSRALWLPLLGAAGSALAGGALTIGPEDLPAELRAAIVITAFVGAAVSAAAAALKAPEKAEHSAGVERQLLSLRRWLRVIEADADGLSDEERSQVTTQRAILVLAEIDRVQGVQGEWTGGPPWVARTDTAV